MDKQKLIAYLTKHAIITLTAEEEGVPVRGNALASGDDALDKQAEDEIIARLNSGDIAAWFCARVTARYGTFGGTDYLGRCSYASLEEFKQPGGYYDDMVSEAIEQLAGEIIDGLKFARELEREISNEVQP